MRALAPLLMAASLLLNAAPVRAADAPAALLNAPDRSLSLEAGSGQVLTLRHAAVNVFVADPKVAEVRPASANALFVFGIGPGRTTVAALDADGLPVANYEITVHPSGFAANEAQAAVNRMEPGNHIRVTTGSKGLMLSGDAASPEQSARAMAIARTYMAEGQTIEDQISLASSIQVSLRVRIIEMSRSVVRSLGINWQALGKLASFSAGLTTVNPLTLGTAIGTLTVGTPDINAVVDALATDSLARVLAEPNLTAMSGQTASFLAGGEYPVPVGGQNGQISIDFKRYGVNLSFTPTVLNSGRINLHVTPEVSELTQTGSVQIAAGNSTISVPALTVRRADTSVELGSGESFAIAGLLQDNVTQAVNGLPGLGDLPVLGALFRSNEFQRQETELVILVTPYIVKPVADPGALHMPGENSHVPSDLERIIMLRQIVQNRPVVPIHLPSNAGFIVQ